MKLIEKKKYTITFPYGTTKAFYDGKCDTLCGQPCDCCGKELKKGHQFSVPLNDNTTYDKCFNGDCKQYIAIGNSCIKKLNIVQIEG